MRWPLLDHLLENADGRALMAVTGPEKHLSATLLLLSAIKRVLIPIFSVTACPSIMDQVQFPCRS